MPMVRPMRSIAATMKPSTLTIRTARFGTAQWRGLQSVVCWLVRWSPASPHGSRPAAGQFLARREADPRAALLRLPWADSGEGGLRLDDRETALAELDSGSTRSCRATSEKALLLDRVSARRRMRTDAAGGQAAHAGRNRRCCAVGSPQGAKWEKHWAFVPPKRHEPPAVKQTAIGSATRSTRSFWRSWRPADSSRPRPADKRTLARRAYFGVTGSAADGSSSSSISGGRIARRLGATGRPAARLAALRRALGPALARPRALSPRPTASSATALKPNAWKYRDYVIRSLNDDKPYDQFLREQLAGDELDDGDRRLDHRHWLLPAGHLGR